MITNFEKSNQYRDRIHDLIPGGAHTYSKGDDQFPILSPAAIDYGKGAYVWDLDGNKYLDCSLGLSAVNLGHAYEPVLEKVRAELLKGVNFQRPSVIEGVMAEKFLNLLPCHDLIKFAKNGSSVTTAAVKLSRAYTGRDMVAYPESHPFYSYDDWFIGSTECKAGVPKGAQDLTKKFKAYDIESLKALFEEYPNQFACIITEPEKTTDDQDNGEFLRAAIKLCHDNGALFILDEIVTGFKTDFPGSIKKFDIKPDLTTWGKGIANGFSFCALTGIKDVMSLGGIKAEGKEKVFLVSTTHGGETHAIAAGIATIEAYENEGVLEHNHMIGNYTIELCRQVIIKHGLQDYVKLFECEWLPTIGFLNKQLIPDPGLRTLAMQEMIKRGVLFQGILVPCFMQTKVDIEFFANALDGMLSVYGKALSEGYENFLIGEPAKPVFRKYI
jgi:glutamate-1-semialdehyde 2,1-aminomutase